MHQRKRLLTLGELIRTISQFAHNNHEVNLAVADLLQRGVVKLRNQPKHQKIIVSES